MIGRILAALLAISGGQSAPSRRSPTPPPRALDLEALFIRVQESGGSRQKTLVFLEGIHSEIVNPTEGWALNNTLMHGNNLYIIVSRAVQTSRTTPLRHDLIRLAMQEPRSREEHHVLAVLLAELGARDVAPILREALLTSGYDSGVRELIVHAFDTLDDSAQVDFLLGVAETDQQWSATDRVKPMRGLYWRQKLFKVRQAIQLAMRRMGERALLTEAQKERAEKILVLGEFNAAEIQRIEFPPPRK